MILICDMESLHLSQVYDLEKICFPNDFWTVKMFEEELKNDISLFLVAIDDEDEKVVGYAGVWFMGDVANITNVAVMPEYRRNGIGKMLINALISKSAENDMSSITLEVRESNIAAQKLYKGLDFEEAGFRKHYYKDRENALIMTKAL